MKTQITKVSIYQNAKFLAVMILPFSLIYTVIGIFLLFSAPEYMMTTAIIFIFAPIWFSLMYVVTVTIIAVIYNFLASKIGGIEFELTEIKD